MTTRIERKDLIEAYTGWAYEKMGEGWKPSLITLAFNEIGGGQAARQREMAREVHRVYGQIVSHLIRSTGKRDTRNHPLWFVCADLPVFKHDRDHHRDIAPNDGLHLHAFALTPFETRGGRSLEDIINEKQRFLSGGRGSLFRVHSEPVVENAFKVVDYAMKAFRTGRVGTDDLFVLPRTYEEMVTIKAGYQDASLQAQMRPAAL